MTIQKIKLMYQNILETGTVTPTTENTNFPKYRLYDRNVGLKFKGNSTPANFYITIDQGVLLSYEVDRLIIPKRHNFDGLLTKLQYSTDNFASDINDAASWTQSGSGLIDKEYTAQTKRYWRLNIAAPASAPELTEMFLTKAVELECRPRKGFTVGPVRNINRVKSYDGHVQKVKWGSARRKNIYDLTKIDAVQMTALRAFDEVTDGVKSFYIEDAEGTLFWAETLGDKFMFRAEGAGYWGLRLEVLEMLA